MEAILRKEIIANKTACRIIGVLTFVILTALGGFVRIPLPFTPVPITLQTFFVLLAGAFLGRGLGVAAQSIYVFLGIFGLGPTSGYLIGFIVAAFLTGNLIKYARNNFFLTFIIFSLADLVLLLCGMLWLKLIFGYSFTKLLFIGVIPFIPGDAVKALAASAVYLKLKSRIKEIF
jgi:biotin transport system substrate-specific component